MLTQIHFIALIILPLSLQCLSVCIDTKHIVLVRAWFVSCLGLRANIGLDQLSDQNDQNNEFTCEGAQ
jgi:hypothetical protein